MSSFKKTKTTKKKHNSCGVIVTHPSIRWVEDSRCKSWQECVTCWSNQYFIQNYFIVSCSKWTLHFFLLSFPLLPLFPFSPPVYQKSIFSGRLLSLSCSSDRLRKSFVPSG